MSKQMMSRIGQKIKISSVLSMVVISLLACSSSQVNETTKSVAQLLYGTDQKIPVRKDLLDTNVKQELDYEYAKCMGSSKKEKDSTLAAKCSQTAYAIVKQRKEIDKQQDPAGSVIVEQVEEGTANPSDKPSEQEEQTDN